MQQTHQTCKIFVHPICSCILLSEYTALEMRKWFYVLNNVFLWLSVIIKVVPLKKLEISYIIYLKHLNINIYRYLKTLYIFKLIWSEKYRDLAYPRSTNCVFKYWIYNKWIVIMEYNFYIFALGKKPKLCTLGSQIALWHIKQKLGILFSWWCTKTRK